MRRAGKKSVKWKKPPIAHEAKINSSLPPSVEGQITGRLCVQLLQIKWDFNIPPPAPRLHVRLKWWGEAGAGTIFKVPVVSSTAQSKKTTQPSTVAFYDIKASWKKFNAYLNDMGSLILDVGLGDVSNEAMLIGQTVVKHMGRLCVNTPIEEYCEIANSDGITLGKIWVKLTMNAVKQETRLQELPILNTTCEEFVVGPAVRRQAPITKQTDKIHKEEFEDSDSLMDQAPKILPVAKTSARREAISSLLDRSKKLRDAMINSILDTENTIKEAETLCENTKTSQPNGLKDVTEVTELLRGQYQTDHNQSFMEPLLHHDEDDARDHTDNDRIVDLVLKGHRVDAHRKNHNLMILDHLLSSDEDDTLDDSILTDSSGPMHNKDLLQELLYSRDKNKSDGSSSVVVPAAAAFDSDSSASSENSQSPPIENKKLSDKIEKETVHLHSIPASKRSVRGVEIHKGFGKQGEMKEKNILNGIGIDRLTRLGRVNAAKVLVGQVSITDPSSSNHDDQPARNDKGTYFVEYRFPVVTSGDAHKCTEYEVTRVASKKILNQSIAFSHRSLFPVAFSSQVVRKWWNGMLFFRLYHRNPGERMPQLIGRAKLPLRHVLRASQFSLDIELAIHSMNLQQAVDQNVEGEEDSACKIGTMKVHVELLPSPGKVNKDTKFDSSLETVTSGSDMEIGEQRMESEFALGTENRRKLDVDRNDEVLHPPLLQMLLMIPNGLNIMIPSSQQDTSKTPPNSYLVCKIFCCDPYPRTQPIWNSSNPSFSFKQTFPLRLSKSLLTKVCNNFMVVEVWHRTAGNVPDILVGLVKIALHQFFLAFSDEDTLPSLMKADYPVVAMDSYCPIMDPITAKTQGHLAIVVALGSSTQINRITKELSSGQYKIHRPHRCHGNPDDHVRSAQSDSAISDKNKEAVSDGGNVETTHQYIQHVFEVVVEGVRDLSLFANTIWGEADCFIQYHFPKQFQQLEEDGRQSFIAHDDIELHPYRTSTTLCTPDPSFSHETKHILTLPVDTPVQKALMACYRAGGMGIELWKRFYYPNIRDQLVAKATLPTAKLCAIVTMRRTVTASIQSFSLPLALTLKDSQTGNGGLVDFTIKYYDVRGGQPLMTNFPNSKDSELQSQVTVSVGILRATGLKDAAVNACKDSPVSMAFAAEVGVNAYAKLKLPLLSAKNEYTTKTIARSFNPEFSHFFDITLPVKLGNRGHTSMATSLAERLEHSSAILEVWHCMPKHQATTTTSSSDGSHTSRALFARSMKGALHDVLLGSVEIPLSSLLIKHTGINGWFPLVTCSSGYDTLPTVEQQSFNTNCVGGVELSIGFSSAEDRNAVLHGGTKLGWTPAIKGISINSETGDTMATWKTGLKLEIHIEGALLPTEMVVIPTNVKEKYKLCYLRYKFYDRVPVVSKLFSITSLRENKAFYKVFHTSSTHLTNTESLKWYLLEECLEVQLWLCESTRDRGNSRPNSRDILVGTASVPLLPLACTEGRDDVVTVKNSFMLFKAGLNSLNGQCMYIKVTGIPAIESHQISDSGEEDKSMIVSESDGLVSGYQSTIPSEGIQDTPASSSSAETSSEEEGTKLPPVSLEEMFQASVIIHEAMHVCLPNGFQDNDVSYCYVTMQPHPGLDKFVTSMLECNTHLTVWETQALTHIPIKFLSKQCGGLQFHLWCKDAGGKEERVGIVHLDLTPLASGLRQLCGWYHIVDHTGQPKGQMRLSVTPTSRMVSSKSALLLSTKSTSVAVTTGDQEAFNDIPDDCTSSFLVNHLRQNINELDVIHKNLEARLEQLETRTSHVHHLTNQQNHEHQDVKHLINDRIPTYHQSLHLNQDLHQHSHTDQSSQTLHVDPLINNDPILIDQSKHDHQPVHGSESFISSHVQVDPISSYTTTHIQHSREQSPTNSSVDCSSSSSGGGDDDDEGSNISSNVFGDNEMDPPSSIHPHPSNTVEATTNTVTHKSSTTSSSVLSDSCVSESEDERSSVEADGQPCYRDRVAIPLNTAASCDQDNQHDVHVSIASNLTTVTPAELSSLSDDESNEPTSSSVEDNREQDEIKMAANGESSEGLETSPATSVVTQSLLNRDMTMEEQHHQTVTDNLRDVTNSSLQPPPATLHQEDEQTSPPSTVQKSPQRFGLGSIPPKIQLPNFFMPPHELEQTMRRLKMTALTRPPPREFDHIGTTGEKQKVSQPRTADERTRQDLSLQDMQRVARIFASKPS